MRDNQTLRERFIPAVRRIGSWGWGLSALGLAAMVTVAVLWAATAAARAADLDPLPEPVTIRIAEDGAASGAGFYLAEALGYFREYNLHVEWVTFVNSDDMLPAIAAGQLDLAGGISSASLFNAVAQGFDVRIIADKGHAVDSGTYFSLVVRKELAGQLKDYSDMKGLTVAYSAQDAVDHYMTFKALEAGGLSPDDVELVVIQDFAQMLAGLATGAIDVAMEIEPLITAGVEQGIIERFLDTSVYLPGSQVAVVLASPDFVNNREVALRFMLAYLKGLRDFNDVFFHGRGNRDAVVRVMTQYTLLKDPDLWFRVKAPGLHPDGKVNVESLVDQYEFYKANGALVGEVDPRKVIDLSLAEEAVAILGPYRPGER